VLLAVRKFMANSVISDEGRLIVAKAGEALAEIVTPPPMINPTRTTKPDSTRTGQELREVFRNTSWPSILVPFGLVMLILLGIVGLTLLRD
jgi:hypothetical protein